MKILIDISQNQLNILRMLVDKEIDKCEKREVDRYYLYNTIGVYKADLEDLIKQLV